tara:strand:+ start:2249 stop:3406 length:1158 start_codon:yes stop_codon:yes gene_type:complete
MQFKLLKFKAKLTQVKGLECLNCKQPLTGNENFCSYCGQKNSTKKLSFGHFLSNLFNGFLNYDSRFWTTFIPLLTKPGKVSKDYIEGKRARFVNPFQLYLHVSIIFFLILGISNSLDKAAIPVNKIITANQQLDSLKQTNQQQLDSILNNVKNEIDKNSPNDSTSTKAIAGIGDFFKQSENYKINNEFEYHIKKDTTKMINVWNKIDDFQHYYKEQPDLLNEQALDNLGYEKSFWNSFYYQQVINANKNYKKIKEDKGKEYINKLFSYLSVSLFIFLPVFTLFLMIIYWRRKHTYMEHLVFVFNTQTVFFLLLSIFFLIGFVVDLENVAWVFIVLFLIYLYKALRYFYQQRRLKTILKFILLNSYYLFLGMIGFIIVAVLSFFIS